MENQTPIVTLTPSEQHAIRLEKVRKLREMGIDPWPATYEPVNSTAKDIIRTFMPDQPAQTHTLAGRLVSSRSHGKTAFGHILDYTGRLQIYLRKDVLGDDRFNFFMHFFDIGDIVWLKGSAFKTKTGEITLEVHDFKLLSKCLYPLPEKFHGISDVELRYRQRYLDLISSSESRERFRKRAKIIQTIRSFLDERDFLEVETPILHPIPGGAAARPFITHHNALHMDLYLRVAAELYIKRLILGSFERVYEIGRVFRNEGISTRHNPEFTMIDINIAYIDYRQSMEMIEQLIRKAAFNTNGGLQIPFGTHIIDFEKPFLRISPKDALVKFGGVKEADLTEANIDKLIQQYEVKVKPDASLAVKTFALFEELAEPHLIQPTYIVGFPVELSPLSKCDPQDPHTAARYELYIAGMEIANGFNELNDPFDQADRFKEQARAHAGGDIEAMHYDAEYVQALEYGLPPNVGCGIGIDRLTMLMTNTTSIKDVILFPTLKLKPAEHHEQVEQEPVVHIEE